MPKKNLSHGQKIVIGAIKAIVLTIVIAFLILVSSFIQSHIEIATKIAIGVAIFITVAYTVEFVTHDLIYIIDGKTEWEVAKKWENFWKAD